MRVVASVPRLRNPKTAATRDNRMQVRSRGLVMGTEKWAERHMSIGAAKGSDKNFVSGSFLLGVSSVIERVVSRPESG